MFKSIDPFLIKHDKKFIAYYVFTIVLFLIFGGPEMTEIFDKVLMILGTVIGMFFFPITIKLAYKFQRSINRKKSKFEIWQLTFFQIFAVMIMLTVVIGIFTDPGMVVYSLMVSNIGVMLTIELAKMRQQLQNIE